MSDESEKKNEKAASGKNDVQKSGEKKDDLDRKGSEQKKSSAETSAAGAGKITDSTKGSGTADGSKSESSKVDVSKQDEPDSKGGKPKTNSEGSSEKIPEKEVGKSGDGVSKPASNKDADQSGSKPEVVSNATAAGSSDGGSETRAATNASAEVSKSSAATNASAEVSKTDAAFNASAEEIGTSGAGRASADVPRTSTATDASAETSKSPTGDAASVGVSKQNSAGVDEVVNTDASGAGHGGESTGDQKSKAAAGVSAKGSQPVHLSKTSEIPEHVPLSGSSNKSATTGDATKDGNKLSEPDFVERALEASLKTERPPPAAATNSSDKNKEKPSIKSGSTTLSGLPVKNVSGLFESTLPPAETDVDMCSAIAAVGDDYDYETRQDVISSVQNILKPKGEFLSRAELLQASKQLRKVMPYNFEAWRLHADILLNALRQLETRQIMPDESFQILAIPLRENDIRDAAEAALRQCAHFAGTEERRIKLIDEANSVRRLTWF